jgi:hypothetical protein
MAFALGAGLCFGSGFALVSLFWPRRAMLSGRSLADNLLFRISLAAGCGLGIFSVIFYLSLAWGFAHLLLTDGIVFAVLVAGWAVQWRLAPDNPRAVLLNDEERDVEGAATWFRRTFAAAFVAVLLIAVYAEVTRVQAFPRGDGWDAFTIWNLHARFLFLGGPHWRDGFTALVGGSHPDYPLLLPAATAHFWTLLGRDDAWVPAAIGTVFTFATAGILFAGLAMLRGRRAAMMAAMALLSTPFFVEQGADQYADIPLSFFFLATVVLLCWFDGLCRNDGSESAPTYSARVLFLAGLAAGFAAWTKNEGLLFLCAVGLSRVVVLISQLRQRNESRNRPNFLTSTAWKSSAPLLAALPPGLLLVVCYKRSIGIAGDLFSNPANALSKLADPARYWTIFAGYVKGLLRFGHWLWIPGTLVLLALFSLLGRDSRRTRMPGFRTSISALSLTFTGYFGVFLITPYDLHWHLRFSLVRLFLQLWPSALFLSFLALGSRTWSDRSYV